MHNRLTFYLCIFSVISAGTMDTISIYNNLKQNWYYFSADGKMIRVEKLGYKCSGNNCSIMANNSVLNLDDVYRIKGNKLYRMTDEKPGPELTDEQLIGMGLTPSGAGSTDNATAFSDGFVKVHNFYRNKTGVPDLVWDQDLADYAAIWAKHLKQTNGCRMQHRTGANKIKSYGENLAWASGRSLNPYEVTKMWYDEIKDYNYSNNRCSGVCGHYTQVIWKTSVRIGCAKDKCGNSEIWVCNYDPPGNWVGVKPY